MTKAQKIGLITFGVFMTEAIIHYNVGVKRSATAEKKGKFVLPPTEDFIKLGLTVAAFSIVNGILVEKLSK